MTLTVRRHARWLTAVVGLTGSLAGCNADPLVIGPEDSELRTLIDEHCASVSTCGCVGEVTDPGCTDTLVERWEARRAEAANLGLTYDAECFEALVAQVQDYDCYWPGGPTPLCSSFCAVFHGSRELGERCSGYDGQASDCAQGLLCADGSCVEPCTVLNGRQQGEQCYGELEGVFDDCAQGLGCSIQDQTCQPLAAAGESCLSIGCGPNLVCAWQDQICRPAKTEGQACDYDECAEGLYCEWQDSGQACQAYATEGQSCSNRPCGGALMCNDSSVCVAAPREGEPCLWGSVCAEGYVCDPGFGACTSPPEAGASCLQGSCATGAWCDTSEDPSGLCALAQPVGEMCSGHRQCDSNYCPNGFCWGRPLEGESCEGAGVCAAGLVCNGLTCEPTSTRAPAACSYAGW